LLPVVRRKPGGKDKEKDLYILPHTLTLMTLMGGQGNAHPAGLRAQESFWQDLSFSQKTPVGKAAYSTHTSHLA
jgi:hypothetical protein